MSFWGGIWDAVKRLFNGFVRVIKRIIVGILNFAKDVVRWFKNFNLDPRRQTPFVINAKNLKDIIADAPVVNCGIFAGVYDNESETITESEIIEADKLDSEARDILSSADAKDGLVVLN